MRSGYYFKNFIYGAIFWLIITGLFIATDLKGFPFFPQLISLGIVSALFYPFSYQFVEQQFPVLVEPTHWLRWVGFITLSLAIPLGIIQLLIILFRTNR